MKQLAQLDLNTIETNALPGFRFAGGTIGDVITRAVPYIFAAAGIMLLLYLISGGFSYMTSAGDPKAIQAAKGKITNALVGFLIIFISYWIVQLISVVLGLQTINQIFPGTAAPCIPGIPC